MKKAKYCTTVLYEYCMQLHQRCFSLSGTCIHCSSAGRKSLFTTVSIFIPGTILPFSYYYILLIQMIPGTSLCAPYRVLLLVYDRATRLCQLKRSRCYIFLSPHRVLCTTNTVLFIVQPAVLKCRSVSQIIPGDVAININIVTNNSHWLCRGTASTEYLVHTNNTNHTPKSQTNSGVSVLLLRPLLLLAVSF